MLAVGLLMGVSWVLWCGDEHPVGRVNVSAAVIDATHCPTIAGIAAAPGHVPVGKQISLTAVATPNLATDNLAFAWLPDSSIANATSADGAVYTCPASGPQSVTVRVTETSLGGACSVEQAVTVTCLPSI
jgi:hypothetical protein